MVRGRRSFIAFGVALLLGSAGCSGSGSGGSGTIDCQTHALGYGDGDLLSGGATASIAENGEDVLLTVPLSIEKVRNQHVKRLKLYDADEDLQYVIPVSASDRNVLANTSNSRNGNIQYQQHLGKRPFNGQYTVVAVDNRGNRAGSVTIEFNCFGDADE